MLSESIAEYLEPIQNHGLKMNHTGEGPVINCLWRPCCQHTDTDCLQGRSTLILHLNIITEINGYLKICCGNRTDVRGVFCTIYVYYQVNITNH